MSFPTLSRQQRLLRLLRSLHSDRCLDADQLAAELQVCRRTVFRDLDLIRQAGLQVCYDPLRRTYFVDAGSQVLAVPRLADRDIAQLLLAAQLSPLGRPFRESVRRATQKLLDHLPKHVRPAVTRLLASCQVDDRQQPFPDAERVALVCESIRTRKALRLLFHSPDEDGSFETRFCPYTVELQGSKWTMLGRSSWHRRVTRLAGSTIESLELTDRSYAVPRRYQRRLENVAVSSSTAKSQPARTSCQA